MRRPTYFNRPHITRRSFFEGAGGLAGSFLLLPERLRAAAAADLTSPRVETLNKADNVIFILLTGAISHVDTFDFKRINGVTPASFGGAKINGLDWPTGLMPKMADRFNDFAIVRSMRAWALVHSISQTWTQIGRNPAGALGDVAPNVGSIVALEKQASRRPDQVFPTFVALNAGGGVGQGYFPASYAPFRLNTTAAALPGMANTVNVGGQGRFNAAYTRMRQFDASLRTSNVGDFRDYDEFYESAKQLMYNPTVTRAFSYTLAESAEYGGSSFGNACIVARKVLEADQGTRFVQINAGNFDMHDNIYGDLDPDADNLTVLGKMIDIGFAKLLADLKASGQLEKTLIVMGSEFGRVPGPLNGSKGRDHFLQHSVIFAGAGIKGGRALGSTNATGSETVDSGWARGRDIRPEDVEATILSAAGIDWTTVRTDDPLGRGFEYVPDAANDAYGPINELWA